MRTNQRLPETSRATILVATSFDDASDVALRRAHALATLRGARLVVVHVAPARSWIDLLFFPHKAADGAVDPVPRSALEAAHVWCAELLGPAPEHVRVVLKRGRVAASILEVADEVHASLIVLGDAPRSSARLFGGGSVLAALIHGAPCPVLVARPERPSNEILGATNFADTDYPALCEAARLGVRLGAHVTFMHNVDVGDYMAMASVFGMPLQTAGVPRDPDRDRRRDDLAEVAEHMGCDIESVVMMRGRAADAILDVARSRDADLVVVGKRRRRRATDWVSADTAVKVARDARRSVLCVPLHEREPSGWAA